MVDVGLLLETPQGRLEIYRALEARGRFSTKRDFVRWLAEQEFGESSRAAWLQDWHARLQRKEQRRLAEARRIDPDLRFEVLHSGPCVYCGDRPTQVDHVLPVSRGGGRNRRNLAPTCWPCNKDKWNLTVAEWRERRLRFGQPWPPLPLAEQHRLFREARRRRSA